MADVALLFPLDEAAGVGCDMLPSSFIMSKDFENKKQGFIYSIAIHLQAQHVVDRHTPENER